MPGGVARALGVGGPGAALGDYSGTLRSGLLRMRLSHALVVDMEMADYSEALDPAYTTLEFENMQQVLAMGTGES